MSEPNSLQFILKSGDRTFNDEFEELVAHQKNDKVKSMLEAVFAHVPSSNVVNSYGNTLLHLAALYNNLDLINFLLKSGYDVNAENSFGVTPLLIAFNCNHMETVKMLLDANADLKMNDAEDILKVLITKKDILPETIVIATMQRFKKCSEDSETMARLLVKVDCPMKLVVYMDDACLTQMMLNMPDYRIDIDDNDDESSTIAILKYVMEKADFEHLRVLWQTDHILKFRMHSMHGILDWILQSSLDWGFMKPFFKQLDKWIIYEPCFIRILSRSFTFADRCALQVLLQECNVDVQVKQMYQLDTLPVLFSNNRLDNEDLIELACKRQFNVNAKSFEGQTALHYAVKSESHDKVRLLLELDADCSIKDKHGFTPFSLVCDPKCTKLLLQSGMYHLRIGENEEVLVLDNMSGKYSISDDMLTVLIAHLAIESHQGVQIEQIIIDTIYREPTFKNYYENCLKQVKELMNHEILPSLTLFTILTNKAEKLVHHVQSQETVSKIEEWCSQQFTNSFYSSSLKLNSEKAYNIFRSRCRVAAIISRSTSTPISFDSLIIDKIFDFLCYRDMLMLTSV